MRRRRQVPPVLMCRRLARVTARDADRTVWSAVARMLAVWLSVIHLRLVRVAGAAVRRSVMEVVVRGAVVGTSCHWRRLVTIRCIVAVALIAMACGLCAHVLRVQCLQGHVGGAVPCVVMLSVCQVWVDRWWRRISWSVPQLPIRAPRRHAAVGGWIQER